VQTAGVGSDAVIPTAISTVDRIRDAAVARFGRDGFSVGLRAIAADAGVTAGLVVHHFGSKDGLRQACDEHVLAVIREEKTKATTDGSAAGLIAQLAEVERFAPMVLYVLRSLQAGGGLAAAFVEHMISDAQEYLEAGVAAGVVRPSRDPEARARWLAYQGVGGMLLWATLHPDFDPATFGVALREYLDQVTLPAIEVFTQGLLVDRSMLDDYLMYVPDPPAGGDAATSAS
jgi:AcrR family transcriptional regulator